MNKLNTFYSKKLEIFSVLTLCDSRQKKDEVKISSQEALKPPTPPDIPDYWYKLKILGWVR